MYEDFIQWLNGVDRSTVDAHRQVLVTPDATDEQVTTLIKETTISSSANDNGKTRSLENDLKVLAANFGSLTQGKTITMELSEACRLLGRTRIRVDAFKKLKDYLLSTYSINLIITSRKTHGKN